MMFYDKELDFRTKGMSKYKIKWLKGQYMQVFEKIFELMNFSEPDEPLITYQDNESERCLWNPNSKAVCIIMWLYSIEPPFYAAINEACRNIDKKYLRSLGPFAAALFTILVNAEGNKIDKLQCGESLLQINDYSHKLGNYC